MADPHESTGLTHERAPVETLGYELAREELVEVVRQLESGGLGLEESLALWERGELLARRCQQWLDGARERLDAADSIDEQASDARDE
ncbi:exodeoxyribonuclease VII small subunit [Nocardioides insulae]|uniref:exodeoxyribonuclease VII small subunit n=1 Tax=Nocardioides insulae TaxID=394734 RepID=UPI000428EF51|nr:exodeoxyribonuclease VII small subunit [Nocardioides insulae]